MDIPKDLRHLLLQRGGMERITKELEARKRIQEKPNVVYSTELEQRNVVARDRNKGCCPSSSDLRSDNVFDRATSGRTKFWSLNNGTVLCSQEPRIRVNGESHKRR